MGAVRAAVFQQNLNKLFLVFSNRQVLLHLLWKLLVMADDGYTNGSGISSSVVSFTWFYEVLPILICDEEYARGVVGCDSLQYAF